jgi:hypothetical protein
VLAFLEAVHQLSLPSVSVFAAFQQSKWGADKPKKMSKWVQKNTKPAEPKKPKKRRIHFLRGGKVSPR